MSGPRAPLDIVFLGNLLVDDIVLRDGTTLMGEPGGAMLYASLAARLWGAAVGLVTIAGSDYPPAALAGLAARGIDLAGVRPLGRHGVRTWLLYEPRARRVIHHLGCPTHAEVSPTLADIPPVWAGARAFHLSPMPIDRQRELTAGLASLVEHEARALEATGQEPALSAGPIGAFISLDPHESVREDNLEAWGAVLDNVDAFFPSEDELGLAGADLDPAAAIERIPGERLRIIAFKRGANGGVLVDRERGRAVDWRARAGRVVDATGAGDAFAGGFLAGWVAGFGLDRAVEQGVVSASFAIEDWGSRGLMRATPEMAAARRREWFDGGGG